jgi:hypothetical protein
MTYFKKEKISPHPGVIFQQMQQTACKISRDPVPLSAKALGFKPFCFMLKSARVFGALSTFYSKVLPLP